MFDRISELPSNILDFVKSDFVPILFVVLFVGAIIASIHRGYAPLSRLLAKGWAIRKANRRSADRLRTLADSIMERLKNANAAAEWADRRYAELEAEVMVGSDAAPRNFLDAIFTRAKGPRRVNSLSKALANSDKRLIVLHGDPGGGKSVALRHVGIEACRRFKRKRITGKSQLPLYVNLKNFRPDRPVSADTINDYIKRTSADSRDLRVTKFFNDTYQERLESGGWLFLFDGFDEIPSVLSAVEVNQTIDLYSRAIADFMARSHCRAVVASREYRGPRRLPWPKFYIASLSEDRRKEFLSKANLDETAQETITRALATAPSSLQALTRNPMFFGLVCEFVEQERRFPETSHEVFEAHARRALNESDSESNFGLSADMVRDVAESVAYVMSAELGMGLSATTTEIKDALRRAGAHFSQRDLEQSLGVLTYVRLMRDDDEFGSARQKSVSFSHRRFQEYFATCYVLQNPHKVAPSELLTDGRWRETAVTILQTQGEDQMRPLLKAAETSLEEAMGLLQNQTGRKIEPRNELLIGGNVPKRTQFDWPPATLHVLNILDSGLVKVETPGALRVQELCDKIINIATEVGTVVDRKWALEVSGPISNSVLLSLLRRAFTSGSGWVQYVAFRQVGRIIPLPSDIVQHVDRGLLTLSVGGRLRRERLSFASLLRGTEDSKRLRHSMRLAISAPIGAAISAGVAATYLVLRSNQPYWSDVLIWLAVVSFSVGGFFALRTSPSMSWSVAESSLPRTSRVLRSWGSCFAELFACYFVTLAILFSLIGVEASAVGWMFAVVTVWAMTWPVAVILGLRLSVLSATWVATLLPHASVSSEAFRRIRRNAHFRNSKALLMLGALVATTALVLSGAAGLMVWASNNIYVASGIGALFAIFILAAIFLLLRALGLRILASWRARRYVGRLPHRLSADECLDLFEQFPGGYLEYVFAMLLANRTFRRSPGLVPVLKDLSWLVESGSSVVRDRWVTVFRWRLYPLQMADVADNDLLKELVAQCRSEAVGTWFERSPIQCRKMLIRGPSLVDSLGPAIEECLDGVSDQGIP